MRAIAIAIAHPNIALVKYWGKRDDAANLPAVGSLSITLGAMRSRTVVEFDAARREDSVLLNGRPHAETARRVGICLDLLRQAAGVRHGARVETDNDFPTGAGLASSASGFAALAVAAAGALKLDASPALLAEVARLGSGSAPRSLFGGFAVLRNVGQREGQGEGKGDGNSQGQGNGVLCEPLLDAAEWPLRVVIAVTSEAAKDVSSRDGMAQSRATSPFYAEWLRGHDADLAAGLDAVRARDFARLAEIAEHNCLKMHAVMMTTQPPLLYWAPATLACIQAVRELRARGTPVFFTIDAGAQVKAVCLPHAVAHVHAALGAVPGVARLIDSELGGGARLVDE